MKPLEVDQDPIQPPERQSRSTAKVYKARIAPHWFDANKRFWYRNDLHDSAKEFIVVDAELGTRASAFDHQTLAAALSKAASAEYLAQKLPFDEIEFVEKGKAIEFNIDGKPWKYDLESHQCSRAAGGTSGSKANIKDEQASDNQNSRRQRPGGQRTGQRASGNSVASPDGKMRAFVRDNNVFLRFAEKGNETQLSQDGKPGLAYGLLEWSPDSKTFVAFRIEPGEEKNVYRIESSPRDGGRARLHTRPYPLPGDKLTAYELNLFDVTAQRQTKPAVERIDFEFPALRWNKDGKHFTYEKIDRGHQRFRVVEVDAYTGQSRNLIDEVSKTFIWTAHAENLRLRPVNYLPKSDEIIYASERDGWRHLYLVDAKEGKIKNQITSGTYAVRGIDRIDDDKRQIWFSAGGKNLDQDPYFVHYYRVNFDGSGLTALTEGNGNHTIQYSPNREYVIDTYSRVDMPPVHELRRVSDGKLVCELEKADITELSASGWRAPEVFVAKGRDGKTDIWGIISRPRNFDPAKKYPVIESIYSGPQGSYVPKPFSPFDRFAALADLGFIVVQMDGMGTANRSKAFHDVCWHNLKDAGLPDHILWHQAVAKKYPYYDLSRVGIYGTSAGGQNSTAAMLFHPEFYKAAVSACGCHDNRMDKASWNEQWMGYPVGPQYAECSNIDNAHRLQGKLLLIVGEMDDNVPPESTLRLADALIKANKDFELLVVPGAGHGLGGAYGFRRLQDFFVRHLLKPVDKKGSGTVVRSTLRAVPATVPDPFLNHETEGREGGQQRISRAMPAVTLPPESFFQRFRENERDTARQFYKKYMDIKGLLPAAASAEVSDQALERTFEIVTHLLACRPDVLEAMGKKGTRLIIIGKGQVYTDMPEYRRASNPTYLNERVRGTGGFDVTSFGEENLLNLPLDRYDDESIAVHEFCHTIDSALGRIDPTWRKRLVGTYKSVTGKGLWKNTYAGSNPAEYWAEICQSYFDCNRANNWNHGPISTREQLKQYDPEGYELVRTTFKLTPDKDWRYQAVQRQPSVINPPQRFNVNPYYTKFTYAREFVVLGSSQVSDEAMLRANDTIRKMFAYRHDILKALIEDGAKLIILGRNEHLSDLPEIKGSKDKGDFETIRYLDYNPTLKLIVVPEENILCLPGDPFVGRSALVGLLARALYQVTALRPALADFDKRRDRQQYELRVQRLDIEFDKRLGKVFDAAMAKKLWQGTSAARDRIEYWVAGVEAYFDAGGQGQPPNLADRPITTREALKSYDLELYALVDDTMAYREHVDWRFKRVERPVASWTASP